MNALKKVSMILAGIFAVSTLLFQYEFGLPMTLICLGIDEFCDAIDSYKTQKKIFAVISFCIGLFLIISAIISLFNTR